MMDVDRYDEGVADVLNIVRRLGDLAPSALAISGAHLLTLKRLATAIAEIDPAQLRTLRPFDPREAIGVKEAAARAAASQSSIRGWCSKYAIGRHRVGTLLVSKAALCMLIDGDAAALARYLSGDRVSPVVRAYFARG